MNEQAQAEQFTRDLDNLLQQASGRSEMVERPNQINTEFDVVQALITADFSPESQVRQTLKQTLLTPNMREKEYRMNPPLYQRSFIRLSLAALVIALLLFAISPLGATLAQSVIQTIREWQLGDNSTAVNVEGDFEAVQLEDGSTIIQAPPESPELLVEEGIGQEPISFEEAQRALNFTLRQPAFVPDGYRFQGVSWNSDRQAAVEYINESEMGFIGILQTAVGGANGSVTVTFSGDIDVRDVTVNGSDAVWALDGREGLLVWESNDVNYQLMGVSDLDLALQIAESLQ